MRTDIDLRIRCQRCGEDMELRDPGPGMPWTPDQYWVCAACGRHFWTTYPPPNREKIKPAAGAAPQPAPASGAAAATSPSPESQSAPQPPTA